MIEILRTRFRCLFINKMRSLLTITGIAVGVMSVIIVSSIGEVGRASINSELSGMGMDSLVVSVQSGAVGKLTENELGKIKELDDIANAMPLISCITDGKIKDSRIRCMAWGVNEDADNVIDLEILHGRLINRGDISLKSNVCVIDEAIASKQYKRTNIVGKTLTLNLGGKAEEFEIIGVVKNGVNTLQNMLGGFIPDFVYIPYSVMQAELGRNSFDQITVKVENPSQSDMITERVETVLASDDYSVDNLLSQKEKMNNIFSIASLALSAVAGVSLIVSGISIMTVMLVSVSERTREIGIKKSIGADNFVIIAEFLFESEMLSLLGGLFGIASGAVISFLICIITGSGFVFNFKLYLAVLAVCLLIGGGFGVYPAIKAAKLKPVDALHHE